jgi:hypothetical protein
MPINFMEDIILSAKNYMRKFYLFKNHVMVLVQEHAKKLLIKLILKFQVKQKIKYYSIHIMFMVIVLHILLMVVRDFQEQVH